MTATAPPPLPADLTDGLKRLKLSAMRALAPELLVTAKTQRWKPEEFLRKNVETTEVQRQAFTKALKAGVPMVFGTDAEDKLPVRRKASHETCNSPFVSPSASSVASSTFGPPV